MEKRGQEKQLAFILGGSSGIGRACCYELAKRGIELVIHGGHDQDRIDTLCTELNREGGSAQGFICPFDSVSSMISAIPSSLLPDYLIVAFGPFLSASLGQTKTTDWESIVLMNLALPGALISRFGPGMASRGFGKIILFGGTSTDQIRGFREVAAYAAAKTSLGVLAKSAALEWGKFGVSCNVICPGYVETESTTPALKEQGRRRMPKGSLQTTESLAKLVLSVLEGSQNGMNGAIISGADGI